MCAVHVEKKEGSRESVMYDFGIESLGVSFVSADLSRVTRRIIVDAFNGCPSVSQQLLAMIKACLSVMIDPLN